MENYKFIDDHQAAAQRFLSEVGTDSVRTYDITSFNSGVVPSVYPAGYLSKCSQMTVVVSGSNAEGVNWMVFCPYRVDKDKSNGGLVYDIDPLVLTLDMDQQPSPVGVIGYHLDFDQRTTPISGYFQSAQSISVEQIRATIVSGIAPLAQIATPVENALGNMAEYFRKNCQFHT